MVITDSILGLKQENRLEYSVEKSGMEEAKGSALETGNLSSLEEDSK